MHKARKLSKLPICFNDTGVWPLGSWRHLSARRGDAKNSDDLSLRTSSTKKGMWTNQKSRTLKIKRSDYLMFAMGSDS